MKQSNTATHVHRYMYVTKTFCINIPRITPVGHGERFVGEAAWAKLECKYEDSILRITFSHHLNLNNLMDY